MASNICHSLETISEHLGYDPSRTARDWERLQPLYNQLVRSDGERERTSSSRSAIADMEAGEEHSDSGRSIQQSDISGLFDEM